MGTPTPLSALIKETDRGIEGGQASETIRSRLWNDSDSDQPYVRAVLARASGKLRWPEFGHVLYLHVGEQVNPARYLLDRDSRAGLCEEGRGQIEFI